MLKLAIKELKAMLIWFIWHFEMRKGKWTKVPKSSLNEVTGVSDNYKHTWVSYEDAKKACEYFKFEGVGFKIPDNVFFIDLDHKDLGDPFVKLVFEMFPNTYAEWSTSGTGIHLYGIFDKEKIPSNVKEKYKMNNREIETEVYLGFETNRYAAFTGNVINDKDLTDCTDALLEFLDKYMRRDTKKVKQLDDEETKALIKRLAKQKNGSKFTRLFNNEYGNEYNSQSEADIALCSIVAYAVGDNSGAIDRVFRRSKLYREKWERVDYRTETIRKAIELLKGKFSPEVMEHPDFIEFTTKGQIYVNDALLAKEVQKRVIYKIVKSKAKESYRIYVYDDNHYKLYDASMFQSIIKKIIEEYREDIVKTSDIAEAYRLLLLNGNYVKQEEFDNDESLICFNNCILKVTKDNIEMLPHSPDYLLTIKIPCDWVPDEIDNEVRDKIDVLKSDKDILLPKLLNSLNQSPTFDNYIYTLSNYDNRIVNLFLEIIGVIVSNVKAWRMKAGCLTYGKGDTGKSKIRAITEEIIGEENSATCDLKDIEERFGASAIYNTRMAGTSDAEYIKVSQLNVFKRITGGDKIKLEYKGENQFSYRYNGFIWICSNKLLRFGGDDGQWVYDRFILIECKNVIPKDKQDRELLDKMIKEKTGIVHRAVLALQQVIKNGYVFDEPESVKKARIEYMDMNSTVRSFFKECMVYRDDEKIRDNATMKKIHDLYKKWCDTNNKGFHKTFPEFKSDLMIITNCDDDKEFIKHCMDGNYFRYLTVKHSAVKTYDSLGVIGIDVAVNTNDTDIEDKYSQKYTKDNPLSGFTDIDDEVPFA